MLTLLVTLCEVKHSTCTASSVKKFLIILNKLLMLSVKLVRSLFAVFLTCVIALNSFISPAFADTGSVVNSSDVSPAFADTGSAVKSFVNGFWYTFGTIVGGATGTVATCYTVDVLIAPVAPPAAAYLATMCPAIGAAVGGGVGAAGAREVIVAH